MTRPLRKQAAPALLLSLEDTLQLVGFSSRKWHELRAAEELARHQGKPVDVPMPRPVDLAGRPMYRRKDIERWVESLETREG